MSSVKERQRNNVKVGIFVTIALLLAMAVIMALTGVADAFGRNVRLYSVSFNVASGVSDLKPGAEVRVGGLAMGEVIDVRPEISAEPFVTILVDIELNADVTLYDNAIILLSSPLLGAESWLDCPSVGDPQTGQPLGEGETLAAIDSVGLLTKLLGPSNASKADIIVSDIQATMSSTKSLVSNLESKAGPILDDFHAVADETRQLVEEVRQDEEHLSFETI